MAKILIVDDDMAIAQLVSDALEDDGFETEICTGGKEALQYIEKNTGKIDLITLDIMMPDMNGLELCKRVRDSVTCPILLVSAKGKTVDTVLGLESGADDYISKPFGIMELAARVRAVLRRRAKEPTLSEYNIGPLFICPERHETKVNGEDIALTYKEFMLLRILVENMGIVMTRQTLLDRVWGLGSERENRTLDVHIRTLRAKLGPAGQLIHTIRGIGYRLVEE